jgi:hypothetical protein
VIQEHEPDRDGTQALDVRPEAFFLLSEHALCQPAAALGDGPRARSSIRRR